MTALTVLALAFAPGLFWLWSIQSGSRHSPDQKPLLLRTFLFGVAIALPVVLVEWALGGGPPGAGGAKVRVLFYESFVVAGVVEEVGKWLVVRSTMYGSPYFDSPLQGLIYSSAAALGFASIENLGYMLRFGAGVILTRAFFSTLAHVQFSSLWGYAMAAAKQAEAAGASRVRRLAPVAASLAAAIALHGSFDFALIAWGPRGITAARALFAVGLLGFVLLLRRAVRRSPDRARVARLVRLCPGCLESNSPSARACIACGLALPLAVRVGFSCGKCKRPLPGRAPFCGSCGSRLVA